jgi:hypothetical protein
MSRWAARGELGGVDSEQLPDVVDIETQALQFLQGSVKGLDGIGYHYLSGITASQRLSHFEDQGFLSSTSIPEEFGYLLSGLTRRGGPARAHVDRAYYPTTMRILFRFCHSNDHF